MVKRNIVTVLLCCVFLSVSYSHAQTVPLEVYIRKVWDANLSLRQQQYAVQAARLSVDEKMTVYEPLLESNISRKTSQSSQALTGNGNTGSLGTSIGVSRKLDSGGIISLSLDNSRYDEGASPYGSQLRLAYSQPLLSGFGRDASDYQLRLAELDSAVAYENNRKSENELLLKAISAYYDYLLNCKNKEILRKNLDYAKQIVDLNKKKEALSLATSLDVLQAEIEYKKTQDEILALESTIARNSQELSQFMGIDPMSAAPAISAVEPRTLPAPVTTSTEVLVKTSPILRAADMTSRKSKLTLAYYANQALPVLSFDTSLSYGSDARTLGGSMAMSDSSYSVGLSMSYPLGANKYAIMTEREKVLHKQQATSSAAILQDLYLQASALKRELTLSERRIGTTREITTLSQQLLDGQMKKYQLGLTTTDTIIENQALLKNAQFQYYQQLVNYMKNYYSLAALRGALPALFDLDDKEIGK